MTDTKTREQILKEVVLSDKLLYLMEWSEITKYHNGNSYNLINERPVLAAMSEYSSHQNKELLERIKELEEGLAKIARGPLIGESNRFSNHVVRIAKQLLNNKTDKG